VWDADHVELRTVGIDIGSSTSHLMFSRVHMQRGAQGLSSRFVVARREVLWRSPIALTPYLPDQSIDAGKLGDFIGGCYRAAGIGADDIGGGAVILTGAALRRRNTRTIADLVARRGGRFVCASAGHHLEATLAAHGSGSVAFSRETGRAVLHLDIGGGTTKMALISGGEVLQTAAIAAGGRLLAFDGSVAERIEPPALTAARHLGIPLALGEPVPGPAVTALASALADVVIELAQGTVSSPLGRALLVTAPPALTVRPDVIATSGGVAEYLYGHETRDFGDIAPALARALRPRLERCCGGLPLVEAAHRIRATVIGASQFSVQVSGNTVDVRDLALLPRSNVPVLYPRIDLGASIVPSEVGREIAAAARRMDIADRDGAAAGHGPETAGTADKVAGHDGQVALGFAWRGDPSYPRLRALAEGIIEGRCLAGLAGEPLVLLVAGDVASSVGRVLREELGVSAPVIVLDGLELAEFDYVDIGEMIHPAGVVPVTIKSLLFDS
jgi:ethanolamine utilization protein EutA